MSKVKKRLFSTFDVEKNSLKLYKITMGETNEKGL